MADEVVDLVKNGTDFGCHADRARAHNGATVPVDTDHELARVAIVNARPPSRPQPERGPIERSVQVFPV